jgi:hypothetical protein
MSEPMQEAVPAFVVGSDLAQAWSCGATLPMTSAALTDAFLSFSGTPLLVLVNMSTSCFRRYGCDARIGPIQRSTNSTIAWAPRLPIAAEIGILFTGKASLSGGVGPVFAGVADPIGSGFVASLARRGGRRCRPRSFVALEPRCDPQSNDAAAVLQADAGRVLPVFENFHWPNLNLV